MKIPPWSWNRQPALIKTFCPKCVLIPQSVEKGGNRHTPSGSCFMNSSSRVLLVSERPWKEEFMRAVMRIARSDAATMMR